MEKTIEPRQVKPTGNLEEKEPGKEDNFLRSYN